MSPILLLASGVGCATQPTSETGPSPQPSSGRATLVAYVDGHDLWAYDVVGDRVRRLTRDAETRYESDPGFLGSTEIVYSTRPSEPPGASTIESIPIGGGDAREIVRDEGWILDFDVSPDRSSMAYITFKPEGETAHRLKLVPIEGGAPSVLRLLGDVPGRGAGSEDEVSVDWSPDGRSMLVVDTHVSSERTEGIVLLDRDGEVTRRWTGTHARWSPDGTTIYYRGHAEARDVNWQAFDVASKRTEPAGMRPGANNAVLSPDGAAVAYDLSYFGDERLGVPRSDEAPVVYRYRLPDGPEVRVRDGAMAPLWISSDELLVTDVRSPPPGTSLNSWEFLGTVTRVAADGTTTRVAITSTYTAAALFLE